LAPVAYLGGGHGAMSTPFWATIIFFHHVIIYFSQIMGLLHKGRVQRKVRYVIHQPQKHWTRLQIWYWRVWSQKLSWEFL